MGTCSVCKGHRWVRIREPGAESYGQQELKAVCCPACNADGQHLQGPEDWDAVPVADTLPRTWPGEGN